MKEVAGIARPIKSQERGPLRINCGCGAVLKGEGQRHEDFQVFKDSGLRRPCSLAGSAK